MTATSSGRLNASCARPAAGASAAQRRRRAASSCAQASRAGELARGGAGGAPARATNRRASVRARAGPSERASSSPAAPPRNRAAREERARCRRRLVGLRPARGPARPDLRAERERQPRLQRRRVRGRVSSAARGQGLAPAPGAASLAQARALGGGCRRAPRDVMASASAIASRGRPPGRPAASGARNGRSAGTCPEPLAQQPLGERVVADGGRRLDRRAWIRRRRAGPREPLGRLALAQLRQRAAVVAGHRPRSTWSAGASSSALRKARAAADPRPGVGRARARGRRRPGPGARRGARRQRAAEGVAGRLGAPEPRQRLAQRQPGRRHARRRDRRRAPSAVTASSSAPRRACSRRGPGRRADRGAPRASARAAPPRPRRVAASASASARPISPPARHPRLRVSSSSVPAMRSRIPIELAPSGSAIDSSVAHDAPGGCRRCARRSAAARAARRRSAATSAGRGLLGVRAAPLAQRADPAPRRFRGPARRPPGRRTRAGAPRSRR